MRLARLFFSSQSHQCEMSRNNSVFDFGRTQHLEKLKAKRKISKLVGTKVSTEPAVHSSHYYWLFTQIALANHHAGMQQSHCKLLVNSVRSHCCGAVCGVEI